MIIKTIGFIGLGLIGGSIAKKIRIEYPSYEIIAYDPINVISLQNAMSDGVINCIVEDINAFSNSDIIFLCAPVIANIDYLSKLKYICSDDCIITDVGSVKSSIHKEVCTLNMENLFVGGHPMTGSEKSGYDASSPFLLENAYYILTTTEKTDINKAGCLKDFVLSLGALPLLLNCAEHDNCVAVISHVPHIIAFSLVQLLMNNDTSDEIMKRIAAGGFKDITRIASSSPKMWEDICISNKDAIDKYLDSFIVYLNKIRSSITNNDSNTLNKIFTESKNYRDSINTTKSGLISNFYDLYVDILDETGAIATIATILARKSINILNIGIIHNREFEDGVLKITFHNNEALNQAKRLLTACDYTIYERN